jgi:hypothetical protein
MTNVNEISPDAPTKVSVEAEKLPTQYVKVQDRHVTPEQNPKLALVVDTIGRLAALGKWDETLRGIVKSTLMRLGYKYADGDDTVAQLSEGSGTRKVEVDEAVALFKKKKLSLEKLFTDGVLTLSLKEAASVLNKTEIDSICRVTAKAPSLTISAVKDRPALTLVASVKSVLADIEANPDLYDPEALAKVIAPTAPEGARVTYGTDKTKKNV